MTLAPLVGGLVNPEIAFRNTASLIPPFSPSTVLLPVFPTAPERQLSAAQEGRVNLIARSPKSRRRVYIYNNNHNPALQTAARRSDRDSSEMSRVYLGQKQLPERKRLCFQLDFYTLIILHFFRCYFYSVLTFFCKQFSTLVATSYICIIYRLDYK